MKGVWAGDKPERGASSAAKTAVQRCNVNKLRDAIADTIGIGAAVMFSATRDGGAVVVTVLDGNERNKVYPTDVSELEQALDDLSASFGTAPVTGKTRGREAS